MVSLEGWQLFRTSQYNNNAERIIYTSYVFNDD